ncbi:MAG: hypothetical protein CVV44_02615 [Spirochaetae bacterium HGW-Spirochaetae-1]|jgi:hypothetical protein|nr:MAG: hypothetical protein CVV44_02615 [Spirochaetae bacterium HGW-Spirochaetae-1]
MKNRISVIISFIVFGLSPLPSMAGEKLMQLKGSSVSPDRLQEQVDQFVRAIIQDIPSENGKKSTVVLAGFELKDSDRCQKNIHYTMTRMLSSYLGGSDRFTIMDQDEVEDILDDLDIDEDNLYSSRREAELAQKLKTGYVIMGRLEASEDGTREVIKIKVVDAAKGTVLYERESQLDRKSLGTVSENYLQGNDAYNYLPPYLRLTAGMEYYKPLTTSHFKEESGDIGFSAGVVYDINKTHSFQGLINLSLSTSGKYVYDERIIENDISQGGTDSTVRSAIDFKRAFEYLLGYGYIFKTFNKLYIRSSIFLGLAYIRYDYQHLYMSEDIGSGSLLIYPVDGKMQKSGSFSSYMLNPTVDLLYDYNSPISFYISVGYKYFLDVFQDTWSYSGQGGTYSAIMSGYLMRCGVGYYF